jgi:hypothetical protein
MGDGQEPGVGVGVAVGDGVGVGVGEGAAGTLYILRCTVLVPETT